MNSSHLFYLLPPIFLPDNRFGRYAFMWFAGNAKVDGLVQCNLQSVDLGISVRQFAVHQDWVEWWRKCFQTVRFFKEILYGTCISRF